MNSRAQPHESWCCTIGLDNANALESTIPVNEADTSPVSMVMVYSIAEDILCKSIRLTGPDEQGVFQQRGALRLGDERGVFKFAADFREPLLFIYTGYRSEPVPYNYSNPDE